MGCADGTMCLILSSPGLNPALQYTRANGSLKNTLMSAHPHIKLHHLHIRIFEIRTSKDHLHIKNSHIRTSSYPHIKKPLSLHDNN